jgi:GT2 family glycosyltransferase
MIEPAVPGITLLIPTYNRSAVLRQTLQALHRVDRKGIDCDIVVIDNNSSDDTSSVLQQFANLLPLITIKEPKPGKNCALNRALRDCPLREIVVFSDDDITPATNWFREIISATVRWPNVSIFGGKIELQWPDNLQPVWATADWIKVFGYSLHHYAEAEAFYAPPACPFGPNHWVRREVFATVPFFDETIGPRPKARIMGSETSFLMKLAQSGFRMLYCPNAIVRHRIAPPECRIPALRKRGFTFGRGQVRLHGRHRQKLWAKSKIAWLCTFVADHLYASARYVVGSLSLNPRRNCELTVSAMVRFGSLKQTRVELWRTLRPADRPLHSRCKSTQSQADV